MIIEAVLKMFKFIYHFLIYLTRALSFIFNTFLLLCSACSHLLPYTIFLLILICILSKFFKLKSPAEKNVEAVLRKVNSNSSDISYFPIANKGCYFDYPENSLGAIKECITKKCKNVLLDLEITRCGKLVLLHKNTLEKAKMYEDVHQIDYKALENFNISEHHPLGKQFECEKVVLLENFLKELENLDVIVYLMVNDTKDTLIEPLKEIVKKNEIFMRKIIFCCKSSITIYQLRKLFPNMICGLWIDNNTVARKKAQLFKASILVMSFFHAFIRNIVAPVIGINAVFLHKDEFNAQISTLWQNAGVHPIVYHVNSPNEKRYFQQVTKTRYLTDSLRSEPQLIFKDKN